MIDKIFRSYRPPLSSTGSDLRARLADMNNDLLSLARETSGFMPEDEGLALRDAGLRAPSGAWLEIGSYCGKSTLYLGDGARCSGALLYSIDHHRGSEEHQTGEQWHDPLLVDHAGRVNTLPHFMKTIVRAQLQDVVVAVSGRSSSVAGGWTRPLSFVFIDGGHSEAAALADYEGWTQHLISGAVLAIHDVFPEPEDGGRPPFLIYERALKSSRFRELSACGSLRVLQCVADGSG